MTTKTYYGNPHIFTNRTSDSIITLKAGANERLLFDGVEFLYVNSGTESYNPTTGAMIVDGGVGIKKDTYVGGLINIAGSSTTMALNAPTITTNQLTIGTTDQFNLVTSGRLNITNSTINSLSVSNLKTNYVGTLGIEDIITISAYGREKITNCDIINLQSVNYTLSGVQNIGTYTSSVGTRILLVNQSNLVENGVWIMSAGSWTRPSDFNTGSPSFGKYCQVINDNGEGIYAPATWYCSGNGSNETGLIDTANNIWLLGIENNPSLKVSNTLTATNTSTIGNLILESGLNTTDFTSSSASLIIKDDFNATYYENWAFATNKQLNTDTTASNGCLNINSGGGLYVTKTLIQTGDITTSSSGGLVGTWYSDRVFQYTRCIMDLVNNSGENTFTGSSYGESISANTPTWNASSGELTLTKDGYYQFYCCFDLSNATLGWTGTLRMKVNGSTVASRTFYISEATHAGTFNTCYGLISGDVISFTWQCGGSQSCTIRYDTVVYSYNFY